MRVNRKVAITLAIAVALGGLAATAAAGMFTRLVSPPQTTTMVVATRD